MSCKAIVRNTDINLSTLPVGRPKTFLSHPPCDCNSGCRRVALYAPDYPSIDALPDYMIKFIARIRFGADCDGDEVEVDWRAGVVLDLAGCFTQVDVELIERSGAAVPNQELQFKALSACCGAGGARGIATRTYPTATIDNAAFEAFRIPPFAYAVMFATTDPTAFYVAGTGIVLTAGGNSVSSIDGATFSSQGMRRTGWPLSSGTHVGILNTSGGPLTFQPVFLIGV